jgi:hypothetical protein
MEKKQYKKKLKAFSQKSFPYFITVAIIVGGAIALKLLADSQSRVAY